MNKKSYESSAKIFIIGIVGIIIIVFILVISAAASAQQADLSDCASQAGGNCPPYFRGTRSAATEGVRTGYHIVTETFKPREITPHKVLTAAEADSILTAHIGYRVEVSKVLEYSPFHYCEQYNRAIYVKKMRVVVKKNGKLKFKKLLK